MKSISFNVPKTTRRENILHKTPDGLNLSPISPKRETLEKWKSRSITGRAPS